jgi:hypothetical protein
MNEYINNDSDNEGLQEEFELPEAEKRAFKELSRERIPNDSLEESVVSALRGRGLLRLRRVVIELTRWRFAAAAAVCLVLITAAFMFGRWTGIPQFPNNDPVIQGNDEFSPAASLQRTGSTYLVALRRFAEMPSNVDSNQAYQGREIALATLRNSAGEVTRLIPKNVVAGELMAVLDTGSDKNSTRKNEEITIERDRVIKF